MCGRKLAVTCGGVLVHGHYGGGRWVQRPVQVLPELLLVLGVDQLEHTLVHHIRLTGGERGRERKRVRESGRERERDVE